MDLLFGIICLGLFEISYYLLFVSILESDFIIIFVGIYLDFVFRKMCLVMVLFYLLNLIFGFIF